MNEIDDVPQQLGTNEVADDRAQLVRSGMPIPPMGLDRTIIPMILKIVPRHLHRLSHQSLRSHHCCNNNNDPELLSKKVRKRAQPQWNVEVKTPSKCMTET